MPNDPTSQPAPLRRRLPLRYLFSALAALFVLPILVWLVWGWVEAARLDRALDALEARHEPVDIDDFDLKPTTSEQREASHLYAQARKLAADLPITSEQVATLGRTIEQLCSDAGGTGQADILRAFERRYTAVFDLVDRAGNLDVAGWDDADRPRRGSIEEMQSITPARANVVRIARAACAGETDAAAAALFSTLRLRRMWYFGPIFTPTAHSLHAVLSWGTVSPAWLEKLQRQFTPPSDDGAVENWMLRERAYWLSFTMPGVVSDEPGGFGQRRITPVQAIARRLVRPLRDHRVVAELSEFDEALEVARRPWPQTIDDAASFVSTHRPNRSSSFRPSLVESLTRPFGTHVASGVMTSYFEAIAELLARARASIGVLAVARYKHDHKGELPSALAQLTPTYLSGPLIDPYTGRELRYWHDCGGFKVYSVGINRKDDGGKWEEHSDLQQSRRGNPADVGIEVGLWPREGCR
jgi:hypothetical protein